MKLKLELSLDDVNKLLAGLDYYKQDLDNLGQKVITMSQSQIDEYNKQLKEEQEKIVQEAQESEKNNKGKGDNK